MPLVMLAQSKFPLAPGFHHHWEWNNVPPFTNYEFRVDPEPFRDARQSPLGKHEYRFMAWPLYSGLGAPDDVAKNWMTVFVLNTGLEACHYTLWLKYLVNWG